MLQWKTLMAMAFSMGVLTLVAMRAQQQSANSSSEASALTTLDYLEIQQLVTRYAYALDSGADNGYMYAGLFASDGVFLQRNGQAVTGRDALAALAVRNQKGPLAVFHFIMNHAIEPTPRGPSESNTWRSSRSARTDSRAKPAAAATTTMCT